jgi:CubicO group peptidase (beta-lactamase class C family)
MKITWSRFVQLFLLPFLAVGGPLALPGLVAAARSAAVPSAEKPAGTELAEAIGRTLSGWLPEQLRERGVPGAAVAVVASDGVVWQETYGVMAGAGSSPITENTVFCIRSISKSVTALGVLVAVQDGLVDLDAPISTYLADFSPPSRFDERPEDLMTLRHLLSHWAGFTHDPPADLNLDQPGYFERYIGRISDTWMRFPVGYRHHYANYGVDLAGYILQHRSGKSFAEYLREKLLEPLGMEDSTFDLQEAVQRENRATGHDSDGDVVPVPLPEIPAAGLYSTIRDMARYTQFQLNGGVVDGRRILREDLMEQYHSIQFAREDQRTGYCMGLWREPVGATVSYYHEGGGRGFGSHMIFYPELGIGVVLLTNREYHGLTGLEGRALTNAPVINRYGPLSVADPGLARMQKLDIDDPRIAERLGRYGDSPGMFIGFENGVLGIRLNENRFLPMTFYEDDGELVGMYGALREARFLPELGSQPGSMMTVSRAYSNSNSHYLEFNDSPLDPPGPAKEEWQEYLGRYDVLWEDEPYSEASITIQNGYLYFRGGKCREHEPGLFFLYDGEALDFRSDPPTFANQVIRKRGSVSE